MGDEADARRASLVLLKKAVVALETLLGELGLAHCSMLQLAEAEEVRSSSNCLLSKRVRIVQSRAFYTECHIL